MRRESQCKMSEVGYEAPDGVLHKKLENESRKQVRRTEEGTRNSKLVVTKPQ